MEIFFSEHTDMRSMSKFGIVCPICQSELKEMSFSSAGYAQACLIDEKGHAFPGEGNFFRVLPKNYNNQETNTLKSFNFQYGKYDWIFEYDIQRVGRLLKNVFQIEKPDIDQRRVAIIGCGNGAEVHVLASLGAESVVGLDLTEAIAEAAMRNAEFDNVLILQGDAAEPPLRKGFFDVVYCDGVLPHTKDPELVLKQLLALPRPGGTLYLRTLLEPRTLRQRLYLAPRQLFRKISTRLPSQTLWRLCGFLIRLGEVPIIAPAMRKLILYRDPDAPSARAKQLMNFRMYGNHKYRHHMSVNRIKEIILNSHPKAKIELNSSAWTITVPD